MVPNVTAQALRPRLLTLPPEPGARRPGQRHHDRVTLGETKNLEAGSTITPASSAGRSPTPASGVVVGWDVWGTDGARKAVFLECRHAVPAAAVAQALIHARMKYGEQLGELDQWRFEVERSGTPGSTVHRFRLDDRGEILPL